MARKRTGQLIYRPTIGFVARITIIRDGEKVRELVELGTHSRPAARAKLRRLLAGETAPEDAKKTETVAEAARRIVGQQGEDGMKTSKERLARLERYALPHVGNMTVDAVRPRHIRMVLEAAAEAGLSKQSVTHLRNDLGGVFGELWREETIGENPVKRVKLPSGLKKDKRPRVTPTDDEFASFMVCGGIAEELHLMALSSRCFGGQRTSDLHAWDWSHIDTDTFLSAKVYRPKTDDDENAVAVLEELVIPDMLRFPLMAWWTRWKKPDGENGPTSGPVFPIMNGPRAGQRQGKRSHARELRAGFWTAGVHRPLKGFEKAVERLKKAELRLRQLSEKGEGRPPYRAALKDLKAATAAVKALDAIQTDTPATRCLDFHSLRRSYNTALAKSGVNVQQAMALAGHRNPNTHVRYVQLAQFGPLEQPANALPRLPEKAEPLPLPTGTDDVSPGDPSENRTRVTGVRGRCPNR